MTTTPKLWHRVSMRETGEFHQESDQHAEWEWEEWRGPAGYEERMRFQPGYMKGVTGCKRGTSTRVI